MFTQNAYQSPNDQGERRLETDLSDSQKSVTCENPNQSSGKPFAPAPLFGDHIQLPRGARITPLRIVDKHEQAATIASWKLSHPNETNLPLFVFDNQDVPDDLKHLVEFVNPQENTL